MEIINRIFTKSQFAEYCEKEVASKLTNSSFKPKGVVLHNTDAPKASQWFWDGAHDRAIDSKQRLANIKYGYESRGWGSGPHLFIAPRDGILSFTPLWQRGTHSPSWNLTHFSVELVGNYDVEALSDQIRDDAVFAIACMYKLMKLTPTADNFKFHKEDPRTTHKRCPGRNVGTKEWWINAVKAVLVGAAITTVTVTPVPKPPVQTVIVAPKINEATMNTVKRWEAFRAKPYNDVHRLAIGYGHTSGIGTAPNPVTADMEIGEQEAHNILYNDLTHLGRKLLPAIKPEILVKLSENQWGAMLSFAYNIGIGGLLSSTLLRKVNLGDFGGAALEFPKWNKSKKAKKDFAGNTIKDSQGNVVYERVELPGLTKRRLAEKALFES
jgi:GH24 family phage-related lysozyme (muramidase)